MKIRHYQKERHLAFTHTSNLESSIWIGILTLISASPLISWTKRKEVSSVPRIQLQCQILSPKTKFTQTTYQEEWVNSSFRANSKSAGVKASCFLRKTIFKEDCVRRTLPKVMSIHPKGSGRFTKKVPSRMQ